MQSNWKFYKNHHHRYGQGALLDVTGEKPWDHYSFVFYRDGYGETRVSIYSEYWDTINRIHLKPGTTAAEFFKNNHSEGAKILERLGITGDVFTEFLQEGEKIINRG